MSEAARSPLTVGPYRITGVLGRGGMGIVYRAEPMNGGAPVAVKTLRRTDRARLDAMRREIRALSRLQHPGVVRLLDDGADDGRPWYAMDLLEGETLRDVLRRLAPRAADGAPAPPGSTAHTAIGVWPPPGSTPPPPRDRTGEPASDGEHAAGTIAGELRAILRRLCATLAYLHGNGVVHRDLKPENVFVKTGATPVLVDLGIAARFGGGRDELEAAGAVVGSAAYMAPEQIRGELVDARADLYALGAILYECITGAPPFTGPTPAVVLRAHIGERPVPPSARREGVPAAIDRLVASLLTKRPSDRLGYADDVARALLDAPGESAAEWPGAPAPRAYLYRPEIAGRAGVVEELTAAIEAVAKGGRGGRILIGGESGIGKTRIALEAARAAARHGVAVVAGAAGPAGAARKAAPLEPFAPALVAVADRCRALGASETTRLLGGAAPLLAPYERALADLPGGGAAGPLPPIAPESAPARVVDAVVSAILGLADAEPMLLVLDDLQWADDLSLACLRALADVDLARRALLVIGTYRSEEAGAELEALAAAAGTRRIDLARMSAADAAEMAAGMLALPAAPEPLAAFLDRHSNGNPFFVAEYLHAAVAEGVLARDAAGRWRLGARGALAGPIDGALGLPRSLAALIERRLDALDPDARTAAHAAAVLGRDVDESLLAATIAGDVDLRRTGDAVETLRRRRILEEADGGGLRFAHDTIREVTYAQIPAAERRDRHRRAAEAMTARSSGEGAARTLAHHFARAEAHGEALLWFERAGAWARAAYANDEAIACFHAALAASHGLDAGAAAASRATIARAAEGLGDVLALTGAQDDARPAYRAALDRAGGDDAILRARLLRKIGKTWETHHHHEAALDAYAEAEAALRAGDAPRDGEGAQARWDEWLQIQIDRISVHYWMARADRIDALLGEVREAVEARGTARQRARFLRALFQLRLRVERYAASADTVAIARACLAACEEARDAAESGMIRYALGTVLLWHGALDEAERRLLASLDELEAAGDAVLVARCLTYITQLHRRRRDVYSVTAFASRTLVAAETGRMTEYVGAARANLGWVALARGDRDEAERSCAEAIAIWQPLSLVYPFQWTALLPLAAVALERGDAASAREHARAAIAPEQQRLPDAITRPIEGASSRGAARAAARVRDALAAARELGYL